MPPDANCGTIRYFAPPARLMNEPVAHTSVADWLTESCTSDAAPHVGVTSDGGAVTESAWQPTTDNRAIPSDVRFIVK